MYLLNPPLEGELERSFDPRIGPDLSALIAKLTDGSASIEPGSIARLTGGYDTDTLALRLSGDSSLPPRLVLRLLRENETRRAVIEATVHNTAADAGRPVPRVFAGFSGERVAGRPFLLMERVYGAPLMEAVSDPAVMAAVPKLMATFHSRVHGVDPTGLIHAWKSAGIDADQLIADRLVGDVGQIVAEGDITEMEPVARWLREHAPGTPERLSICHGDFHPGNLMVDGTRLTGIIDWANVRLGRPEFDVGVTRVLLTCGPLEGTAFDESARPMLEQAVAAYTGFYKELSPLDDELVAFYETLRASRALARVMARDAGVKVRQAAPDGYAWGRPDARRAITRLIERNTGIAINA
jgi:aminoglycoside phosphotransferase (APT) family kinase protein